jgi:ankyrin repeat protein
MNIMYSYLKIQIAICALYASLAGFGCANVSAEPKKPSSSDNQSIQCVAASRGELDLATVDYGSPEKNAYFFNCAVAVFIPDPGPISGESKSKEQRMNEKITRTKIADFFLSKEVDVKFRNEYGDTLLMSVVLSFLPDEWKEGAIKRLIRKGVDINAKNADRDTALDLANHMGKPNLMKILAGR